MNEATPEKGPAKVIWEQGAIYNSHLQQTTAMTTAREIFSPSVITTGSYTSPGVRPLHQAPTSRAKGPGHAQHPSPPVSNIRDRLGIQPPFTNRLSVAPEGRQLRNSPPDEPDHKLLEAID
jgi:hypothetical protein